MKSYLFLFFFLLVLSSLKGQNFECFVDETKFTNPGVEDNQYFVDKVDGYFIFGTWHQNSNDIFGPMVYSLQKIDGSGNVFDELELFGENSPRIDIHKTGENYLLSYWDYTDLGKFEFHLLLINRDFEELEYNKIKISDADLDPEASFLVTSSRVLNYKDENILFAPFPLTNEFTYLLKLRFDNNGFYKNEMTYQEEIHLPMRALYIRQPVVLNDQILLNTLSGLIVLDSNLVEVKRLLSSETKIPNYMISGGAFGASDKNIFTLGTYVSYNQNIATPFITKLSDEFKFDKKDTLNLKFVNPNPLFKPVLYKYSTMDECFAMQEDSSFTGIMGYSHTALGTVYLNDGSNSNTLTGRVIISKFDRDLNLLCQNNIYLKNHMLNVYRGVYLGKGEYLITGSIDSIELENDNAIREFHPFFGIIKTDCHVPWSEGTLSTINHFDLEHIGINFYPDPTHDLIKAEFIDQYNYMSCKIIDMTGKEVWRGKSADLKEGIKVGSFSNGIYHVLFDGKYVGRFVKL